MTFAFLDKDLSGTSLSAFQWDYLGSAVRMCASMLVTVVLARLLGPEPFGLVAIAWIVIGIGNLFADLGMSSALVQRSSISDVDVRAAFTCQVAFGASLSVILILLAPFIGDFFKEPKVVRVVHALAPLFVLQAFGAIAASLLKRALEFKRIQLAQVTSYLIGFVCIGIPLAAVGFAVWSLIIAQLSQTALFSLFCYTQIPHPAKPLVAFPDRKFFDFGVKVLISNLINWTLTNLPSIVIGRVFDVFALGLYNRAYMLITTPMQSLVASGQAVTFSGYSRRQDDLPTIRTAYLAGVGFMTLAMLPAYGSIALVPESVVQAVFGADWHDLIPLIVPLALAMPFHALMALGGPMLWSQDRVESETRGQILTLAAFAAILVWTVMISVTAIAWGIFAMSVLRFFFVTSASLAILDVSWREFLQSIKGGLIVLMITGPIVLICDQLASSWHIGVAFRVALDLLTGMAAFLLTVHAVCRQILSTEMYWLWGRINHHLSGLIGNWLRKVIPLRNVDGPVRSQRVI